MNWFLKVLVGSVILVQKEEHVPLLIGRVTKHFVLLMSLLAQATISFGWFSTEMVVLSESEPILTTENMRCTLSWQVALPLARVLVYKSFLLCRA